MKIWPTEWLEYGLLFWARIFTGKRLLFFLIPPHAESFSVSKDRKKCLQQRKQIWYGVAVSPKWTRKHQTGAAHAGSRLYPVLIFIGILQFVGSYLHLLTVPASLFWVDTVVSRKLSKSYWVILPHYTHSLHKTKTQNLENFGMDEKCLRKYNHKILRKEFIYES